MIRIWTADNGSWGANLPSHPVYLTYEEALLKERYAVISQGVVYRVAPMEK